MAVSQFLKPGSLLESVQSFLTPGVIRNASSLVGESESSTRRTMNGAVGGVLSGITNLASSREGAGTLTGMIREGGYGDMVGNIGSFMGGGSASATMLSTGQQLLGRIFGGSSSSAVEAVAREGGVNTSSAGKLMSVAAPLVMGVLAKRMAAQKLDSSGLANLLQSEKTDIAAHAPSGFSQLLSRGPTLVSSSPADVTTRETELRQAKEAELREPMRVEHFPESAVEAPVPRSVVEAPAPRSGIRWLPLLIAGLIALGLIWALRSRTARNASNVAARGIQSGVQQLHLPGGTDINVAPGTINYDLAKFLGDPNAAPPKTFVFDNLNFDSNTSQLTPASGATVDNLATVLRAYPKAQVQLVGHTDNTGSPEANQTLSLNRANVVKNLLVGRGVTTDRITTQGMGQDRPIASNDTDEGRSRNRRTELVVTSK